MNIAFKKKINRRMRIFEHRILSFVCNRICLLAGKSATVEQMLLTESIKKKKMVHTY